jgi:UDP-2,4-diacetamido-2,4,6-trideoxy-beta-L-altropyranose hydrolase
MIIFRCNAGPQVGFGHLMRCRTLALKLKEKGMSCIMVGPDTAYANVADKNIFKNWISVSDWVSSAADCERLVGIAKHYRAGWLVLDDYRVDENYQLHLHDAGVKWLQFDGAACQPLWADLILNANPAVQSSDYTGLVRNPDAQLLLGPAYALLRSEFPHPRQKSPGGPLEDVLVTFGGGDDRGAVEFVLTTLLPRATENLNVTILSGAANVRNKSLERWIAQHGEGRVRLLINPDEVAPLFAEAQLVIMAGGTTTYEAASCGAPMILMTIASNQVLQSRAWQQLGAAEYLGAFDEVDAASLAECFGHLQHDDLRRLAMSQAGRQAVDGRGAERVAHHVVELVESESLQ